MSRVFLDLASASIFTARLVAKDSNSRYWASGRNDPLGESLALAAGSSVSPLMPARTSGVDILEMTTRPSAPLCCTNQVLLEAGPLTAERAASAAELSLS